MRINKITLVLVFSILAFAFMSADNAPALKFGLLKYSGGGDWYSNPTALPNLAKFCNKELHTNIDPNYETIDVGNSEIFNYSFIHMTGHGNVVFSEADAENLRLYLQSGGFLHIDDNYGMDTFVRVAMKQVFPDLDWVELPFTHEIYHKNFEFKTGLPKIHKHDGKPAQGFALIWEGRVVCYYSYETDLGDGWEDQEVHNDTEEMRAKALQMGANIVQFAYEQ